MHTVNLRFNPSKNKDLATLDQTPTKAKSDPKRAAFKAMEKPEFKNPAPDFKNYQFDEYYISLLLFRSYYQLFTIMPIGMLLFVIF